jgi:hypothetical protein
MMRWATLVGVLLIAGVVRGSAQGTTATGTPGRASQAAPAKQGPSVSCAAELGTGVRTHRQFCDVLIAADKADSIAITIPDHRGTATLDFDLHNRYDLPAPGATPAQMYSEHEALVAVVGTAGKVIDHAAVRDEFRSLASLYDRLGGGTAAGGSKNVAPGPAQAVKITIPANITSVGVVGVRVTVTALAGTQVFDAPGRAIAIASNFRVEYTPR